MAYKVVITNLLVDGVRHRRGDIINPINPDIYGNQIEPCAEPEVDEKPKRKRRTKAEIEADNAAKIDVPRFANGDLA